MARRPTNPPEYSPGKFVDREYEIQLVREKARRLASGRAVDRRTIIFTGERGTGKTWLLAHLRTELLEQFSDMTVFLIDLRDYTDWDPTLAVGDILRRFSADIDGKSKKLGTTLSDMSRNLMQGTRPILEKRPLALLVDQAYWSDWSDRKLLAALEDYLLGPLAVEPRVLIVMAGRGRAYPWKTPELRLKAQFEDLDPFDKANDTAEQLKRQQEKAVSRAKEIHEISGGNPLANYLLATEENPSKALDQVVRGMLETVPGEERQKVREYLEALCVLRAFDEERIPTMLAAYYDNEDYRDWSYAAARQVRKALVKWAFAHWSADKGGYVLDELPRELLERYLKTAKPEEWKGLQRAASELYDGWAREYERARDRWQVEEKYHIQQLQQAGAGRSFAAAAF
jgi:hypothetical protein